MPGAVDTAAGLDRSALTGAGDPADTRRVPLPLVVAALLLTIAAVAVIVALVVARATGSDPASADGPVMPLEVSGVSASSWLPASGTHRYGADRLLDGDPTTAWTEGVSGDGTGQWVEIRLAQPAVVRRLLVFNGHQKGVQFLDNNRVRTLRIDVGERRFTVELLDVEGPQAVDLPEPVLASGVRLTVLGVYSGHRYNDTALSIVEVHGTPAGDEAAAGT